MALEHWRGALNRSLAGAVVLLLSLQLFVPPALGVADNNDFQKLAGRQCLAPEPGAGPVLFDYAILHWHFSRAACASWPFRTTAEAFLLLASGLNRLFHSKTAFDIRFMGLVYGLVFTTGFVLLQRALASVPLLVSLAAQIAWILVACNAVYVPWFNTFYFDSVTLAALTAALVGVSEIVLRARVSASDLLITSAWLTLIAGSKSQHSVIGFAGIAALWYRGGRLHFAPIWSRVLGTALILSGAALSLGTTPREYTGDATFSALFYRVLPNSPDPAGYLAETRIPAVWVAYRGEHAFSQSSPLADPAAKARFAQWFGPVDLVKVYFRHPLAAWAVARVNLDEASLDRVRMKAGSREYRLGNYQVSTGKPPQTLSYFFCMWPILKNTSFNQIHQGGRPLVYLIYIIAVVGVCWILAPSTPRIHFLLAVVTAALGAEWAVAMLDGVEAGRHLLIFNFLLDLVVCADICFVFSLASRMISYNKGIQEVR